MLGKAGLSCESQTICSWHGLNLQGGGNIIIWFGLPWSLELYQQANARLHRQGQAEGVVIYHLISEGTVDEEVLRALQGKGRTQEEFLEAIKVRILEGSGEICG